MVRTLNFDDIDSLLYYSRHWGLLVDVIFPVIVYDGARLNSYYLGLFRDTICHLYLGHGQFLSMP